MYKEILLPLDLGHATKSKELAAKAMEMARLCGADLHVMTVIPDYGMSVVGSFFDAEHAKQSIEAGRVALKEFCETEMKGANITQRIIGHGRAYKEILRSAKETRCDLIIVSAGGESLEDYLLGPNAARIVRHATCSVHVIR